MRRLLGVAAVAVVISGCTASSHIVVKPDGSGSYSIVLSAPAGSGSDPGPALYKALTKVAASSSVPLKVTHYSSGGETGGKATFDFRSLADLDHERQAMGAAGGGINAVHITRDAHGWHFSAASAEGLVRPPGVAANSSPGGAIDASQLGGLVQLGITVDLPGAPKESNATAVTHDATTSSFSWNLAVGRAATGLQANTAYVGNQASVASATELTALNKPGATSTGSSNHWLAIGLAGGAALLLAAIGVFWWLRRRSPGGPAPEATAS